MGITDSAQIEDKHVEIFKTQITGEVTLDEARRILTDFREGALNYTTYKRLRTPMQLLYKAQHGFRPAAPHEVVGIERKARKRTKSHKAEKQARKRNRR